MGWIWYKVKFERGIAKFKFSVFLLDWLENTAFPAILLVTVGIDPIYPTPPFGQDMTQGQFLKRSLAGLNSEFSFKTSCYTKAEEPSLPYYLPIAGGRIIRFIPFPRVLVLCETVGIDRIMLFSRLLVRSETFTASSRIWFQLNNFQGR